MDDRKPDEEWKSLEIHETTIIIGDDPPPTWFGRVLRFVGKAIGILLLSALPLYYFIQGINGLRDGKVHVYARMSGSHMATGAHAQEMSWLYISGSLAVFGVLFLFAEMPFWRVVKWLFWIAAAVCFMKAMSI